MKYADRDEDVEKAAAGLEVLRSLELAVDIEAVVAPLLEDCNDPSRDEQLGLAWAMRRDLCELALAKATRHGTGRWLKLLEKRLRKLGIDHSAVDLRVQTRSEPDSVTNGDNSSDSVTNDDDSWTDQLKLTPKGLLIPALHNLTTILRYDPVFRGKIRHDVHADRAVLDGNPVLDREESMIRNDIFDRYGVDWPTPTVHEALVVAGGYDSFDPVLDYLDSVVWDGKNRLDTWLIDHLGAGDTPLNRAYARKWMISAIARARTPGCKVDTSLILHGSQGAKKSTAFKILGGAHFRDSSLEIGSKDGYQGLQGVWVFEVAELDSFRKRESTAVKSYLSSDSDWYRPSYGRNFVLRPRRMVFCGSTNKDDFLTDDTGSRRYWIVSVASIDQAALVANRDQLWAEADAAFKSGEPWWLDCELEAAREEVAETFRDHDPWEAALHDFTHDAQRLASERFTSRHLLEFVLQIKVGDQTKAHEVRLASSLRALGWEKEKNQVRQDGHKLPRRWFRGAST